MPVNNSRERKESRRKTAYARRQREIARKYPNKADIPARIKQELASMEVNLSRLH